MFKKGQAATEYLIILAVVIIIALIVIGVMGGIPGLGGAGRSRVSEGYWASQPVGIDSYAVDADGDWALTLRNNGRASVTIPIDGVGIGTSDGVGVTPTDTAAVTIAPGGTTVIRCPDTGTCDTTIGSLCTLGGSFSYNVSIRYTDSLTGATLVENGDNGIIPIQGTCASSA